MKYFLTALIFGIGSGGTLATGNINYFLIGLMATLFLSAAIFATRKAR